MRPSTWRVAGLLFGSGSCALVYQVGWLREFTLIFGASTTASAAVLAIFIGGLGLGALVLGPRADSHPRPILFYSQLESIVAVSAALSPVLLFLVRELYILIGGTPRVGLVVGTIGRLALSALVLAVPTVAMGGTLPAGARGVTDRTDAGRRDVATLYAFNTLGAVLGCCGATFFLLEALGTRRTLWLAAAVNLLVAMLARQLDRRADYTRDEPPSAVEARGSQAPAVFVLLASGAVGLAFFLMELVWYRMLNPLLGGSVFTFGLILAVALAGIGIGGLVYALGDEARPATLSGFGWSCLFEATAIAVPYALGDRLAVLALVLQPLGHATFGAQVAGWTVVTLIVVFPAAVVAGYQFPMLIALLGRGREHVGRQIGFAYAANTIGAILGALAGGFGVLARLGAPGAWRFVALTLVLLGGGAVALAAARRDRRALLPQIALAVVALALLTALGPTAVWRHAGIGAGRAGIASIVSANQLKDWSHAQQRAVVWQGDGTESSVALSSDAAGYAFVVNGKVDGSARRDAGTQVMSGLIGSILNPRARRSLVIGLGTGSTAGWLGAVPAMERVDVVELEPLILDVARACRRVNHDVMQNLKVHVTLGDARETLLTAREQYDIIASEPSNPFRAGIASLFTREYYLAATDRLTPDGLFIQWVQAYDIDARTLRTVYATMASVFAHVETWQTNLGDLVLVGGKRAPAYRATELATRIGEEPFRSALRDVWRAVDLDGFLAHYVAGDRVARAIASATQVEINTDDRNVVEFGFARSVGVGASVLTASVRELAAALQAVRPPIEGSNAIDWTRVDTAWMSYQASEGAASPLSGVGRGREPETARRLALAAYFGGDLATARRFWGQQSDPPRDPNDLVMAAEFDADRGSEEAVHYIDEVRRYNAGEAFTLTTILRLRQARVDEAASALESAFQQYRVDPWAALRFKQRALNLASELGARSPALARRLFEALQEPFAVDAMHEQRIVTRASLARMADFRGLCGEAIAPLEPHVPWTGEFLTLRRDCYGSISDPRLDAATRDMVDFRSHEPLPLETGINGL